MKNITEKSGIVTAGGREFIQPLLNFLSRLYPVPPSVEEYIIANCQSVKVKRNSYLLTPGEICNHYYFICKGLLRAFIKYGKKEVTTWVNPENEIATSIRSMSQQKPSLEYIQALEDTELIVMPAEALNNLYVLEPSMNIVGRIMLQDYYASAEERAFICRIPNAEMRYRHFIDSRQDLVNRVPLKYIASFLGMTEETLSRLRGRKSI